MYFLEKFFPCPFFGQVGNNDVDIFGKYLKIISDYRLFYSRDPQPPMTLCQKMNSGEILDKKVMFNLLVISSKMSHFDE